MAARHPLNDTQIKQGTIFCLPIFRGDYLLLLPKGIADPTSNDIQSLKRGTNRGFLDGNYQKVWVTICVRSVIKTKF